MLQAVDRVPHSLHFLRTQPLTRTALTHCHHFIASPGQYPLQQVHARHNLLQLLRFWTNHANPLQSFPLLLLS